MERKETLSRAKLLKASALLGLKHPKNIKTDKLAGLVDDAMGALNAPAPEKDDCDMLGAELKVFKGYHPITGKPVN